VLEKNKRWEAGIRGGKAIADGDFEEDERKPECLDEEEVQNQAAYRYCTGLGSRFAALDV